MNLEFVLNGAPTTVEDVPEDMPLLTLLREILGLTGAKRGCETGTCGACSVLVNDKLTRSCRTPVSKIAGQHVITIEGIRSPEGGPNDLQQAFLDHGAVQCGFCIPGMIIAGEALLRRNPDPSRDEIRRAISGNICRCTGYQQIIDAIEATAHLRSEINKEADDA